MVGHKAQSSMEHVQTRGDGLQITAFSSKLRYALISTPEYPHPIRTWVITQCGYSHFGCSLGHPISMCSRKSWELSRSPQAPVSKVATHHIRGHICIYTRPPDRPHRPPRPAGGAPPPPAPPGGPDGTDSRAVGCICIYAHVCDV